MGFEVLVKELRASAVEHLTVATELGTHPVDITITTPRPVGHVELAAWLGAIEEQIGLAHTALGDGQENLAEQLRADADDYELTDDGSAVALLRLLRPFAPGFGFAGQPTPGQPGIRFDPLGNLGVPLPGQQDAP